MQTVICAAVAQSVERRIGSAEVTGPIPVSSSLVPINTVFLTLFSKGNQKESQTHVRLCLISFIRTGAFMLDSATFFHSQSVSDSSLQDCHEYDQWRMG